VLNFTFYYFTKYAIVHYVNVSGNGCIVGIFVLFCNAYSEHPVCFA
jgi:hypothetical protein